MVTTRVEKCPVCDRQCEVIDAPKKVFGNTLYPATCVYHGIFYRKIK